MLLDGAFTSPAWLLLAPIVWLVAGLLPRPGRAARRVTLLALVLALAGPRFGGTPAASVVLDVGDSGRAAARLVWEAATAAGAWRDVDVVVAGDRPAALPSPAPSTPPAERDARWRAAVAEAGPGRSDVGAALRAATAGDARRVLLVGDGRHTDGRDGPWPDVPVDVLAVDSLPNVRVDALDAPAVADPGTTIDVRVVVRREGRPDAAADVVLRVDGREVARRSVPTDAGAHAWRLAAPLPAVPPADATEDGAADVDAADGDAVRIEAVLVPADPTGTDAPGDVAAEAQGDAMGVDAAPADDALATRVALRTPPRVTLVDAEPWAGPLEAAGLEVVRASVADVGAPLATDALVIGGPAEPWSDAQARAVTAFVEAGGGLAMLGGPNAFALGGWYRSPIDGVLPVDSDVAPPDAPPDLAMMLVVDRSRSMDEGTPARLERAKRAARELLRRAAPGDRIGMIAFADAPRTVFPLQPVTDGGRTAMTRALLDLDADGGTVLGPALDRAVAALEASDARRKHVVVLSDGEIDGGRPLAPRGPAPDVVADRARAAGVTISTVAVGDGADVAALRALADAAGGRAYARLGASTLVDVFVREAEAARRSAWRDATGLQVRPHPLVRGLPDPPVGRYVETRARPGAELLWTDAGGAPLLAVRRVGVGRTLALTMDAATADAAVRRWPSFDGWWVDAVRWLASPPADVTATVRTGAAPAALALPPGAPWVEVRRPDAPQDRGEAPEPTAVRAAGRAAALQQLGPGRWAAPLPPGATGADAVVVSGDRVVAPVRAVVQDPEFGERGGDATLRAIATATGGERLGAWEAWTPPRAPASDGARAALAAIAVAGVLVEAWRRRTAAPGG